MPYTLCNVPESPRYNETAVGKPEQDDARKVLVEHVIHDIGDVCRRVDLWTGEMHALADAGEARRENRVSSLPQRLAYVPEAARPAPAAVYQLGA